MKVTQRYIQDDFDIKLTLLTVVQIMYKSPSDKELVMTTLNDKSVLVALREDINSALSVVAKKYKINIEAGQVRYQQDGFSCSFKLDVELVCTPDGQDVQKIKFETDAPNFGLEASDYKLAFEIYRSEYRLIGFNLRASKNPLIIEKISDGRRYSLDLKTFLKIKQLKKLAEVVAA